MLLLAAAFPVPLLGVLFWGAAAGAAAGDLLACPGARAGFKAREELVEVSLGVP